jgi:hypothetical protein
MQAAKPQLFRRQIALGRLNDGTIYCGCAQLEASNTMNTIQSFGCITRLLGCLLCSLLSAACRPNEDVHLSTSALKIGFFTPARVEPQLVNTTHFGMVNAISPEQLAESLKIAKGTAYKVIVDLGPVLLQLRDKKSLSVTYTDSQGQKHTKKIGPERFYKVFQFKDPAKMAVSIAPYLDLIEQYRDQVSALFLADEPYLNGISKAEMEAAAQHIKSLLLTRGLDYLPLGIIFSSGMFDASFASHINRAAGDYAYSIDQHLMNNKSSQNPEFRQWRKTISQSRLTTYEQAGNMYTGGGIPQGYDIIGFNFYLSTLLLDAVHNRTLQHLASRQLDAACDRFSQTDIQQLRKHLSFFQDGPVVPGDAPREEDKQILDAAYNCRMNSLTRLLAQQNKAPGTGFVMFSETSNNGVLEFDARLNIESGQPSALVEWRVLEETRRATNFYLTNQQFYNHGLLFFTYANAFDHTIQMAVGGAANMPAVLEHIFALSKP